MPLCGYDAKGQKETFREFQILGKLNENSCITTCLLRKLHLANQQVISVHLERIVKHKKLGSHLLTFNILI